MTRSDRIWQLYVAIVAAGMADADTTPLTPWTCLQQAVKYVDYFEKPLKEKEG